MYFCGLFLLYLFFQWYFRVARMMMSGDGGDGSSSVWRLWLAVNSRRHNHRRTTNKMVRRKLWIICWWTGGGAKAQAVSEERCWSWMKAAANTANTESNITVCATATTVVVITLCLREFYGVDDMCKHSHTHIIICQMGAEKKGWIYDFIWLPQHSTLNQCLLVHKFDVKRCRITQPVQMNKSRIFYMIIP